MCSNTAVAISDTFCGIMKVHLSRPGGRPTGDCVKCGTPFSRATPATAIELGVIEEPTSTSTFSSVTSRRALVVAWPGSLASSSRITVSFWPAISFGQSSVKVFLAGTPSAAAEPVAATVTPTLIWASAVPGKASAAASTAARPTIFVCVSL